MLDFILILTLIVIVWRRGWRWWALVPLLSYFAIAFLAGIVAGLLEVEISSAQTIVLLLPLTWAVYGVLMVMAIIRPRSPRPPQMPEFRLP
jgi:hypothetical protein